MSERHLLKEHAGGWRPSRPDHRHRHVDPSGIKVLPEVDPRKNLPAVYDQKKLGSCTGHATEGHFEFDLILDGKLEPGGPRAISALDIYWHERNLEGEVGRGDTGAMGHDAYRAAKIGFCAEKDWAYDDRYNEPDYFDPSAPPEAARADERFYVLRKSYGSVPRSQIVFQQVLSNRQAISFGFSVYESFESPEVARSGVIPMPGMDEEQLGGHEVLLVGYLKDEPNYGLVRNSWGPGWGIEGYFLMPWAYLLDPNLASDHVTIQRPIGG